MVPLLVELEKDRLAPSCQLISASSLVDPLLPWPALLPCWVDSRFAGDPLKGRRPSDSRHTAASDRLGPARGMKLLFHPWFVAKEV